jgi:outer membrane lipoprotein-sorting protein
MCCFSVFASLLLAASPEPLSVDSLLARFRALPGLQASFHETKRLLLLKAPLTSEGTIHFAPPGMLARHTTGPADSMLIVDSREVRFRDADSSQSIPLEGNPVVRLFVDAFLKVLEGDKAALEKIFTSELKPAGAGWTMVLLPRIAPMNEVIDRLVLEGNGAVLSRLTVREKSGDETVTTFSEVDIQHRYSPDELHRIFGKP